MVTALERDFMSAFLLIFGAGLLFLKPVLGSRASWMRIRVAAIDADRLRRALDARKIAEGPGVPNGRYAGIWFLLLAPVTYFTALPPAVAYALAVLGLATSMATEFVRLRSAYRKRVASLRVRSPWPLPPWLMAAMFVAAGSPLVYVIRAQDALAAVLVSASAAIMLVLASRVAALPPLLIGDDVAIEEALDERIRTARAGGLMYLAGATLYVFASFTGIDTARLHLSILAIELIAWIGSSVWLFATMRRLMNLRA